jgi:hypothetical protein
MKTTKMARRKMTMKMSDVKVGMRLRSVGRQVPMEEFVTVTEITERGFKYSIDEAYAMIPRLGMSMAKDGHEHFGIGGEALFEVADEVFHRISVVEDEALARRVADLLVKQMRSDSPLARELCQLVDARTR